MKIDQITEELAQFIASGGKRGRCPNWWNIVLVARTLAAPVWDVDAALKEEYPNHPVSTKKDWLVRAAIINNAEIRAQQILETASQLILEQPQNVRQFRN